MAFHRPTVLAVFVALLCARMYVSAFVAGGATPLPKTSLRGAVVATSAVPQRLAARGDSEGKAAFAGIAALAASAALGAAVVKRQSRRAAAVRCEAFSSSSSGFMGTNVASSYISQSSVTAPQEDDYSSRSGVASLGMKAQVWYIQNNGFDGKSGGKIFDWKRRESRRRGEELFRHDVDNFELTLDNIIGAPGSKKKKIVRGRGKYGSHGRTCGFGNGGAKKRGRRTINPSYEGGNVPLHIRTPKLSQEDLDSMRRDPYTPITLADLNMCDDGDEVDYMDLFVRGYPVKRVFKYDKFKVKGSEEDELNVKNLTVYAHAFEPPAREKIEALGGRCVRLHEWAGIPLDEGSVKVLAGVEEESGAESEAESESEE